MSAATLFDVPPAPAAAAGRPRGQRAADPVRLPSVSSSTTASRSARPAVASSSTTASSGPRSAAALGPVARPAPSRAARRVTVAAVVLVAAVAAVASFDHQRELAVLAGEGWRAWLLPLSVDGLVVAASMTLLASRRAGQRPGVLPWLSLVLGVAASLAANVAAAEPTLVGRLVAAWPPVALLLAFELLLRQVRR